MCTDMSKHPGIQKEIIEIGKLPEEERDLSGKNKNILLRAVVHAADISNPTKPFDIAVQWSKRIVQEFFN
jgi:hypothetical protein